MHVQTTAQELEWRVQRKCGLHDEWGDAKLQWSKKLGLAVRFDGDAENANLVTMPRKGLEVRMPGELPAGLPHSCDTRQKPRLGLLFTNLLTARLTYSHAGG